MTKPPATDLQHAQNHRYRVVSGGPFVPGVTSVLGIVDKPALVWKASEIGAATGYANAGRVKSIAKKHREWLRTSSGNKEARQKKRTLADEGTDYEVFLHWARGEHRRVWDAKADRGTRVHDVAERWAKGEHDVPVQPEDNGYIDALEKFWIAYKPKILHVECVVLNYWKEYGGRFDVRFEIDGPGFSGIYNGDWKTGDRWIYEESLQAIGYEDAELAEYNEDGTLVGTKPPEHIDGSLDIHLRPDGTFGVYDPFDTVTRDLARTAFYASLELYKARKQIDKIINEEGEGWGLN